MEITFGYEKNLIICSSTSQLKMAIESSKNEKNIIIPDLEVLPYDNFSPHPEVSSNRLISFRDILKKSSVNVFTTIPALFQPLFDQANINNLFFEFKENQSLDRNSLLNNLAENGYEASDLVSKPSQFALRGSVIDLSLIHI